jgi:hypothetical protein
MNDSSSKKDKYVIKYILDYKKSTSFCELKTAAIYNFVFWDVALCRSYVNRRFEGTYRLHIHEPTRVDGYSLLVSRLRIFLP